MNENAISVVNDVKMEQDGDITHFTPVDDGCEKPIEQREIDNRSWFGKLVDWLRHGKVTPYVKVRDWPILLGIGMIWMLVPTEEMGQRPG